MMGDKNYSLKQTKIPSGWKVMSVPLLDPGWHSKIDGLIFDELQRNVAHQLSLL